MPFGGRRNKTLSSQVRSLMLSVIIPGFASHSGKSSCVAIILGPDTIAQPDRSSCSHVGTKRRSILSYFSWWHQCCLASLLQGSVALQKVVVPERSTVQRL